MSRTQLCFCLPSDLQVVQLRRPRLIYFSDYLASVTAYIVYVPGRGNHLQLTAVDAPPLLWACAENEIKGPQSIQVHRRASLLRAWKSATCLLNAESANGAARVGVCRPCRSAYTRQPSSALFCSLGTSAERLSRETAWRRKISLIGSSASMLESKRTNGRRQLFRALNLRLA